MIKNMQPGSVIYDLAAVQGGNVALTKVDKVIEKNGVKIFIGGAGMAAALPGVIAAHTHLPVLGVPIESKSLKGIDSLLSIAQMPAGIPVGTLAIGEDGAINAALLASAIIANYDSSVKKKLNLKRM